MVYIGSTVTNPSPIIYPSSLTPNFVKELKLPDYGIRIFESEDGTEIRQKVFSTGHGTELQFDYSGRNEDELLLMCKFYAHCKGAFAPFMIPTEIVAHPASYLAAIVNLGSTGLWRFSDTEPLTFTTTLVGIYSFTVRVKSLDEQLTVPDTSNLTVFVS